MDIAGILLVEDDPNLGTVLEESLVQRGFAITLARDGEQGLHEFRGGTFDLCLIDVMLPLKDGFTLARDIRRSGSEVPIIFLTAKSLREDRIEGLRIGADDYITKPFSIEELILRIKAVLRRYRSGSGQSEENVFEIGSIRFEYPIRTLFTENGQRKLTGRESELLLMLCRNMNRMVLRDTMLERIWGESNFFASRSMDVYISRLRKYLSPDNDVSIVNVHGKGFTLVTKSG